MSITTGQIVFSSAGRDKGMFFVVIGAEERFAFLCDGKARTLAAPKKKKDIHIKATKTVLPMDEIKTDRAIREALSTFSKKTDRS